MYNVDFRSVAYCNSMLQMESVLISKSHVNQYRRLISDKHKVSCDVIANMDKWITTVV